MKLTIRKVALTGGLLISACINLKVMAQTAEAVLNTPGTPAVIKQGNFAIAVIPDTQYYLAQAQLGGNFDMFKAQIEWIQKNQVKENIAYVAHMGDVTEHGDNPVTNRSEWYLAKTALYRLENPISIPYGLAVGNHDQFPAQYSVTGTTNGYNQYFGVKHFEGGLITEVIMAIIMIVIMIYFQPGDRTLWYCFWNLILTTKNNSTYIAGPMMF